MKREMWMRCRNCGICIVLICISLGVALAVGEGLARVYVSQNSDKFDEFLNMKAFRAQRPAAYEHSEYFSQEFIEESFAHPGGWHLVEDKMFVIPHDFSGKFFNIKGGLRATTDALPASGVTRSVFVFGGSTIYNGEVPDKYTICSYLQRMLNSEKVGNYKVFNYGVSAVAIRQEYFRLKDTDVKKGDVVIFYDGVNDLYQGVYNGNFAGWMIGNNRQNYEKMSLLSRVLFGFREKYPGSSSLVKLLLSVRREAPGCVQDTNILAENINKSAEQYLEYIKKVNDLCREKGATFYHFVQPTLYTVSEKTQYELMLLQQEEKRVPGVQRAYEEGYSALINASKMARKNGISSHSLVSIFDEKEHDIFLDFCHVSEMGNYKIAKAIFASIQDSL